MQPLFIDSFNHSFIHLLNGPPVVQLMKLSHLTFNKCVLCIFQFPTGRINIQFLIKRFACAEQLGVKYLVLVQQQYLKWNPDYYSSQICIITAVYCYLALLCLKDCIIHSMADCIVMNVLSLPEKILNLQPNL